ncbi:peroxisome proliferator-activated receptor alpha-like isoform X2 [Watersipora subatra]|uniref:peroxisome proliferator-activated receptor alpha-like isoform X2 n=1 Tax=Watersipora subatra TaxID=2589382 RepID=UPI00355B6913
MSVSDAVDLTLSIPGADGRGSKLSPTGKLKKKKKASVLPTFLPPCRVCNATASGYHYGANTCEACKAFFRRSIGQEDAIKPCQVAGKCAENPTGKISCSDCRRKKCLQIGMAKEGCRKGRYTYEKRTQDTKEIRRRQAEVNVSLHYEVQQCAETVAMLFEQFEQSFLSVYEFYMGKEKIDMRVREMLADQESPLSLVLYSPGHSPNQEAKNWVDTINANLVEMSYHAQDETSSAHNMVFDAWAFQTEKNFHGLASYVKCLPGFSDLQIDDRIILLKEGRVDSLSVLKHKSLLLNKEATLLYDNETGDIFLSPIFLLSDLVGEEFVDGLHRVNSRLQKLNLNLEDIAVLLAFVIFMSDREGLQRTDQVERLQDKMLPVFQYCMQKNHPDEPNIVAETLLILPLLRETTEVNKKCLSRIRHRIRPDLTPLLSEMLQI